MQKKTLIKIASNQVSGSLSIPLQKGFKGVFAALIVGFFISTHSTILAQSLEVPTGPFISTSDYLLSNPLVTFSPNAKVTGYSLPITHYRQCGQTWSSNAYGSGSCSSICSKGCALSSGAMVLKFNGTNANPSILNSYLQANTGYLGCVIKWTGSGGCVDNYSTNTMSWYGSLAFSLVTIKNEILLGNPVIVHVNSTTPGQEHFIVIYGFNNNGTVTSDFLVADPASASFPTYFSGYTLYSSDSYPLRVFHNVTPSCGVPSGIYSANITSNFANVYLSSVTGATQYKIGLKPSYSSTYTYYTVTSLPVYLTNLLSGTIYNYVLSAYCPSFGWSAYSAMHSFTTLSSGSSCPTPTGLYLSGISATSATFNWTATNAINYNYYLKLASSTTYTTYPNYTFKPVTMGGLSPGTTYNFRVSSNCSGSSSAQSTVVTFTTPSARLANDGTTGIPEIITVSDNSIHISPNPVNPGGTIKFDNNNLPREVSLCTIDGKVVSSKVISGNSFEIPAVAKGIYFLKAQFSDGNISTTKIVVQ